MFILMTGNPTAILGVIQGQGHMTEKEVEIETGILEFILVTVGVQGGHGTKLQ
jgi:hypothetical protein